MPRINLRLYVDPGRADVFVALHRTDNQLHRLAAIIDTGAEISLLPATLMAILEYRPTRRDVITVEQAGIARQAFEATEAYVTLYLEDETGARTGEFEAPVWFADTTVALIGFAGILDRAALHMDMRTRQGWIEID